MLFRFSPDNGSGQAELLLLALAIAVLLVRFAVVRRAAVVRSTASRVARTAMEIRADAISPDGPRRGSS
jgi:hypothetical protein